MRFGRKCFRSCLLLMHHACQLSRTSHNHNQIMFFRNVLLSRHLSFSPVASTLFVASSRELMANLLESTMELVGGREWSFEALAVPQMGHVPSTEIENPITMEDFLSTPAADVVAFEPLHSCLTSTLRSPSSGGFLAWAS